MKTDKIKQLEKEIAKEKAKTERLELKQLQKESGLTIGKAVEYTRRVTDNDNYPIGTEWGKSTLTSLSKSGNSIFAKVFHLSDSINIKNVRMFDENDYKFRDSVWGCREVDIEEMVQIIVDKPSTTLYNLYEIEKVVKEKGQPITYFYRNDRDSLTPLYENEFYVTQEKSDY